MGVVEDGGSSREGAEVVAEVVGVVEQGRRGLNPQFVWRREWLEVGLPLSRFGSGRRLSEAWVRVSGCLDLPRERFLQDIVALGSHSHWDPDLHQDHGVVETDPGMVLDLRYDLEVDLWT